jgi:hypothetical protein
MSLSTPVPGVVLDHGEIQDDTVVVLSLIGLILAVIAFATAMSAFKEKGYLVASEEIEESRASESPRMAVIAVAIAGLSLLAAALILVAFGQAS